MLRFYVAVEGVFCSVFVFMECLLIGSIICGLLAAHNQPDLNADYVVILGCSIRKDGTLYPLLRGRVDKALAFYLMQKDQTGRTPVLVPSGGKGSNEVMAEAEAMRNYLLEKGVPEADILVENRSRNTFENMRFSDELIRSRTPNARVVFSTTNYHVFRSSMWAKRAGLEAEGIGSRTKWYFWPNAFMR